MFRRDKRNATDRVPDRSARAEPHPRKRDARRSRGRRGTTRAPIDATVVRDVLHHREQPREFLPQRAGIEFPRGEHFDRCARRTTPALDPPARVPREVTRGGQPPARIARGAKHERAAHRGGVRAGFPEFREALFVAFAIHPRELRAQDFRLVMLGGNPEFAATQAGGEHFIGAQRMQPAPADFGVHVDAHKARFGTPVASRVIYETRRLNERKASHRRRLVARCEQAGSVEWTREEIDVRSVGIEDAIEISQNAERESTRIQLREEAGQKLAPRTHGVVSNRS